MFCPKLSHFLMALILWGPISCSDGSFQGSVELKPVEKKSQNEFNAESAGELTKDPKVEVNAASAQGDDKIGETANATGAGAPSKPVVTPSTIADTVPPATDTKVAAAAVPKTSVDAGVVIAQAKPTPTPTPTPAPPTQQVITNGWDPEKLITDIATLERCKMDIFQRTGDFSLCMKCFMEWQASGGKITARRCGCYQETIVTIR